MSHNCKALLVVCMDFRLQAACHDFAKEHDLVDNYDLFSVAGTQKSFLEQETKEVALKQVELSHDLHSMTDVYLISHWDCGAYGGSGAFKDDDDQRNTYLTDMQSAKEVILEKYPDITVHKYLANWDAEEKIFFEKID